MNEIIKSKGSTKSEKYLSAICEKTFLSIWSYPNLYTDEGRRNRKGTGKELCDLLVVFDNDVIIFSDKDVGFGNTSNLDIEWQRWVKRAVLKSANQIYGAEKWLKEKPDRIYLDNNCTQRFPLKLPSSDKIKIHKIVVAQNATERFRQYIKGRGTLIITPRIIGKDHLKTPFHIGQINPSRGYVHILDDISFDILLRELDTASDFIAYLTRKEQFIKSGRLTSAAGEDELLAFYLRNYDENNNHDFVIEGESVVIKEGLWDELMVNPRYLAGKKENVDSYFWDWLIEQFAKNAFKGTLISNYGDNLHDITKALRIMARENRVSRRILSKSFLDKIEDTPINKSAVRVGTSPSLPDVGYVLLLYPKPNDMSIYEKHRQKRQSLLSAYCHALKVKFPELQIIVGLASEPKGTSGGSEDLIYLNTSNWSNEDMTYANEIRNKMGLLLDENVKQSIERAYEFPLPANEASILKSKNIDLNTEKQKKKCNKSRKKRKIAKSSRNANRRK